jgi:hypothetical protein
MRQKLLRGLAWGIVASVALAASWPLAFAGGDEERPGKAPPPDGKRPPPPPDGREPPPPPPPPQQLDRAIEDLQLSASQKARVEKIVRAHHEKMRKIMDKARTDLLAKMKPLLTKEQYQEFERAMRRPGPGGPGGPPRDRPPPPREKDRPGKRPPPPDDQE